MKNTITILITLIFLVSSCNAQLMKSVNESKKLMTHEQEFTGKPFKYLLNNIRPDIRFIYGEPDNKNPSALGTYIKLFFVPKQVYMDSLKTGGKPSGISIFFEFEPDSKRKPIQRGGIDTTKEYLMKEYGDMIVTGIYVTGEN